MEKKVREMYTEFAKIRKEHEALKADQNDMEELKKLEDEIKRKNNSYQ